MKLILTAALAAAIVTFALAALALSFRAPTARAATPTPTPSATLEPTPTLEPGTYIDIEVVHDLNKDGVRQPDEPGVEGATLYGGCSDALISIEPTDSDGRTRLLYVSPPYQGRVTGCIHLQRQFGWLETTSSFLQYDFPEGEQYSALFLVHDLRPDVMEVVGEPILAGLPAWEASIALSAPYAGCIERPVANLHPLLFIVGEARSGCPAPGAQVQILLDGSPAGTVTYTAGSTQEQDLVARGDSMRMYGTYISGATIGGVECGVVRSIDVALSPPGLVQIFVLSDEVRAGCGTSGALVRFYRDGQPLDPQVPWRAGDLAYPDLPEFVPATTIISPNTGTGPVREPGSRAFAIVMGFAALAAGTLVCAMSQRVGRRR